MTCPLCGIRKARRSCPGVGQQICAICCGTKRLIEIQCPPDCVYLQSAREHPPAVVVRRKERDWSILIQSVRDLSQRQSELFLAIVAFLLEYKPPEFQRLADEDVEEAAGSLAATFETSSRGVIYDHRPASLPAARLVAALKPLVEGSGKNGGSAFERDAAFVLRQLADAAARTRSLEPSNPRAFLDLLRRTLPERTEVAPDDAQPGPARLIVP